MFLFVCFVFLLLETVISETSFQVTFLLSPFINGLVSSYGEGLCRKINTKTAGK